MYAATEEQRVITMRLLFVNQVMILLVDFGFALGTTLVLTIVALLRMDAGFLKSRPGGGADSRQCGIRQAPAA